MKLKNKVAIITGVANPLGIGYATATTLAREGALLTIVDYTKYVHDRAKELIQKGYKVLTFQMDLLDTTKVNDMIDSVLAEYGKIDILVNVAGGGRTFRGERRSWVKGFDVIEEKDFDFVVNINLKTTFNCIKGVLPSMLNQKYGKIVNISSVTGPLVCGPSASGYTAAKAGICGLTKTLALEIASSNITINSILPGWIYTGPGGAGEHGEPGTARRAAIDSSVPAKKLGTAEDCADLVLFLASDESSYLTGLEVIIDGGNVIQEMKAGPAFPSKTK